MYVGMEGDSGIVMEDVCEDGMQNLGGRLVLMLMRAGYLVGELVVVVVGAMVVVALGVISFSEKRCLSMMEVECFELSFLGWWEMISLTLVGGFVAMVVEMEMDDLELEVEVGDVVSLVCSCVV